ncbi:hypothetical protein GGI02_002644 [Coemansia sp. RSA 2322]|nr:hypothetical protein GGI02_002644 [Coemansia sp. RSA 2322]
MYQPGFVNGVTAHGIHASGLPVQQAPPGHHQMMPYPRNAMAAGGIGAVYGNAGFPRPLGMPDPATHVHTPSPLGQVPIYGHPSLAGQLQQVPQADPRVTQYPPAIANQAAMNMGYLQAYAQRTQQYQPPPPQQHQMPPPPQQQLPPQQAMTGQHQAALASFIPSQMACRGSLAKNPLMRDINKLKDFSAKDYSARPTLLAEADTRRLAMKSIPGLGGSTCHSYQPEEPPSTQQQHTQQQHTQQQHTQHQQQPRSSGARDYHDIDDHYARPNRYEASYHRSQSCHNLEDEDNDGSSTSSYIGNRHHQGSRGGGGGRVPKRQHHHERGNNAYRSEYSERASVREHRQMPSPRSSHGRRALDRRHYPRRDNQYYEYYDYDEYSEPYASDYDNEWDEERESNPRHGRHYEGRIADMDLSGRRAAHRRPRADVYTTRGRDNTAWESQHRAGRHAPPGHGGYHRRPRLARLDDPRDGDSIVIRSTHPPMSKAAGSSDSESLLVLEHGKPRSQFGRILANLKRHASEAKATSPLLTTQDAQHYDGKDEAEDPESGNRIVEVVSETEENQAGNVEGGLAKPEVATNTSEKSPLATASTNSGSEPDAANLPPPPSNLSASAEADKEEAHDNEHLAPPTPAVAAVAVTIAAT